MTREQVQIIDKNECVERGESNEYGAETGGLWFHGGRCVYFLQQIGIYVVNYPHIGLLIGSQVI